MSWNGNGGDQGPWGQRPNNPQQPDLEQILRAAKDRFGGGNLPGGKLSLIFILGVVLVGWFATGIYTVGPNEQAVVVRFGKYVETTGPGVNMHLPWPIESVEGKPKVLQNQRIEIGFRSNGSREIDVPAESKMLTGDENIIDINMSVQFKIKDAADSLFQVSDVVSGTRGREIRDPSLLIRQASETALREVVGKNKIDEALTSGKEQIETQTRELVQEILDSYRSGYQIEGVQLQQVQPPEEVIDAFKDVASAREDKVRKVNEAQGYSADILPKAMGTSAQLINEAEAYKQSKVARARGDVERFNNLYVEYKKAKDITRTRLYLETMEEVMARANKVIISPEAGRGVLPHLPLDSRIFGSGKTPQQQP
ncbi:protease FtsH subunit HflK [Magnetococcus marinus MC-1]|uniref:Protein HflK n=1 Tax=Magnetococcus marinus (strain ATCC BAA-1437 / JCM 17883 / MC-1) TaxID=156889 RepID=A0L7Y9_MAGMM|nr:FtsH protease activity modulator HflK [Magnetococcus marinus]ABK44082.1 protease FtsH subunit HflK [Magnetococcus marinus MC-1]